MAMATVTLKSSTRGYDEPGHFSSAGEQDTAPPEVG